MSRMIDAVKWVMLEEKRKKSSQDMHLCSFSKLALLKIKRWDELGSSCLMAKGVNRGRDAHSRTLALT